MFNICLSFVLLISLPLSMSSNFPSKSNPCSQLDYCHSKSDLRTCSCESDCDAYGTCCHDLKKAMKDVPDYLCFDRRSVKKPVFAKRSCLDEYRGHVANRLACLDDDEDELDVKNNLLMTSRRTKITYWNKYCAACNNEIPSDLEFWNIEVFCPPNDDIDEDLIRTNLTFDHDKRQWGLVLDGKFLQCVVRYAPPYSANEVKYCTPNITSNCPAHYDNAGVAAKCSQYHAQRKLENSDLHFKNIHCAICNNASLKHLECSTLPGAEDSDEDSDLSDMVKEVFTDGEWLDHKTYECSKGFIYDPTREKCRSYELKVFTTTMMTPNSSSNIRKELVVVALLISLIAIL